MGLSLTSAKVEGDRERRLGESGGEDEQKTEKQITSSASSAASQVCPSPYHRTGTSASSLPV